MVAQPKQVILLVVSTRNFVTLRGVPSKSDLARLQHPHIVPLLVADDVNGLPYYTMPYVEGASLRERLQARPIPSNEAQAILRDVAKALA